MMDQTWTPVGFPPALFNISVAEKEGKYPQKSSWDYEFGNLAGNWPHCGRNLAGQMWDGNRPQQSRTKMTKQTKQIWMERTGKNNALP